MPRKSTVEMVLAQPVREEPATTVALSAPPNLEVLLDRLVEKRITQLLARRDDFLLEPEFQDNRTAKAILRLQSVTHRKRWPVYFERYGCRDCHRKDVPHAQSGYCYRCCNRITGRLKSIERELAREYAQKYSDDPIEQITGRVRAAERLLGKGRGR